MSTLDDGLSEVVPMEGVEPPIPYGRRALNAERIPFRHIGMMLAPKRLYECGPAGWI